MEPFPYTHHIAKVVFYGVIVVFVGLEMLTRFRSLRSSGAAAERLSFFVVVAGVATGVVGALLAASHLGSAAIEVARLPVFLAGVVLTAAGIVLRQWAVVVLGRSFTVEVRVRPGQRVIESGPYRKLAHPS